MKHWTPKATHLLAFGTIATILGARIQAQVGDPATLIQEKLVSQIKLTKITSAHDDIVTAGDVVVLHKDGLVMCNTTSDYADSNSYSNGVLKTSARNRAKDTGGKAVEAVIGHISGWGSSESITDSINNACPERKFVAGEKFWVTDIKSQKDGILISVFSDPYNDVRYYGDILFSFPKHGPVPPVDDFVKTVSEVLTVRPPDNTAKESQSGQASEISAQAPANPDPSPPPMQPIAPPPPPTGLEPPTIRIGQTSDEVISAFGQPERKAESPPDNEIYFYKDVKVTFTKGKVSKID